MTEIERLTNLIENLWDIIDDIDSYGDMAKADNVLYRALCERRQKERLLTGITTDGYTLDISNAIPLQRKCYED